MDLAEAVVLLGGVFAVFVIVAAVIMGLGPR
jgi:hypothetical protein